MIVLQSNDDTCTVQFRDTCISIRPSYETTWQATRNSERVVPLPKAGGKDRWPGEISFPQNRGIEQHCGTFGAECVVRKREAAIVIINTGDSIPSIVKCIIP